MNVRRFIRRWLVCGLCSGAGQAHNPHLAPVQAINALVASLGIDRADFTATPGKLAILVLAYEEVRECGWHREQTDDENELRLSQRDDAGRSRRHASANAPVLDAVFSDTGSWVVPQPIPNWAEAMSPRCCGIAA